MTPLCRRNKHKASSFFWFFARENLRNSFNKQISQLGTSLPVVNVYNGFIHEKWKINIQNLSGSIYVMAHNQPNTTLSKFSIS